jgi:hypothetical protein
MTAPLLRTPRALGKSGTPNYSIERITLFAEKSHCYAQLLIDFGSSANEFLCLKKFTVDIAA